MGTDSDTLFQTGGDMAARMAAKEWAETPLGLPSSWPQSLRAIVRVMLTSRYAMWMAWGPELTFFCNDAYLPTLGVKGSWALGTSARKVWEEIWPDIGPGLLVSLRLERPLGMRLSCYFWSGAAIRRKRTIRSPIALFGTTPGGFQECSAW